MSDPTLRTTSALLAPLTLFRREIGELLQNRTAVAGGMAGTGAFMALAVGLALFGPSTTNAQPPEDPELDFEFMAGELLRRGVEVDPEKIPEKPIVDATQAASDSQEATVTRDDQALPTPAPERPDEPKPKTPATEKPDPNRNGDKPSDRNREGNNEYDDPATAQDLPGDPLGSADGWSDLLKSGDAWATAVLAALNGMTVGSYAGLGQDGTYKFQLVICADGKIDAVRTKKSTGRPDFDGRIRSALMTLKLPKAPPALAKQLAGACKKMPYEFTWSGTGKDGTIH